VLAIAAPANTRCHGFGGELELHCATQAASGSFCHGWFSLVLSSRMTIAKRSDSSR
jgi:hypothetical protein